MKVLRIHDDAIIPKKAHENDACFDMYIPYNQVVESYSTKLIHTGIKLEIPRGYEGIIRPRSGTSLKTPLRIANSPGVIDSTYRGEICVITSNLSNKDYLVKKHQRIAQFTIKKVIDFEMEEVEEIDETSRDEGGFGSTGM